MKYFHDILTKVDNDKNIKNLFEKVETWPRSIEEIISLNPISSKAKGNR